MNREAKIRFLEDLKNGKIKREDIRGHLAAYGLAEFKINVWEEIAPAVFENTDTKQVIKEGDDIKCEPGDFNIWVRLFVNYQPVPNLASSEKEIDLAV